MTFVTLVSGGIDSLVMTKIIENDGEKQVTLFIDYGQLAREREWTACKHIFKECKLPEPVKVDLHGYGQLMPVGITDPKKDIKSEAFLPGRNLLFLVVGASYAHFIGADKVAIGLLTEKYHLFPDQTGKSVVDTNFAVNESLNANISLVTPLINFTKSEVIKLAKHYKLPIEKTYSCHSGKEKYCGECISCKEILDAYEGDLLPQFKHGGK